MHNDIKKKIDTLREQLNKWNYEYYAENNPSVDDAVYDQAMKELKLLESQYPEFMTLDSPTQRVGGFVSDKFNKIKHESAMLSLDNIFDQEGLNKFVKNIQDNLQENFDFVVEPKIDGLSISIIYENSKLKYAVTRGDGEVGEDVTANILTIKNIPQYINSKYKDKTIEVRGEVYLEKEELERINNLETKKFSNCRNAAAGSLRNLDSKVTASRNLKAFIYYVQDAEKIGLVNQIDCIHWLKENGFSVSEEIKLLNDVEQIWEYIEALTIKRNDLAYDIDGIVIKLNQRKYYENIGYTSKFPKWAIAYKFPAQIVSTKLIGIELNVGRTGKITYIARLEPIKLDGSIISAATLHNYDFIKQKNIKINNYVKLFKAGDVIPYVLDVDDTQKAIDLIEFNKPKKCPSCNSDLIAYEDKVDLYCINKNCVQKIKRDIEYFCSRDVMNIEGISYSIIDKLFDNGIIKTKWDLYLLKNKKEEILKLDLKIKDKMFTKLVNSIEQTKSNSLERLISAFAIKNIGSNTAKILARYFKSLANFKNATKEELINLNIIGEKTSNEIIDFLNSNEFLNDYESIKQHGLNELYIASNINNLETIKEVSQREENKKFFNKKIVITGTFSISRENIKNILIDVYGCKVLNTISKNVDYLLAGENAGSKLEKAKELGIEIITKEFWT